MEKRTEKPNENRSITMFAHAIAHLNGSQPNGFLDEWPTVSQTLFINLQFFDRYGFAQNVSNVLLIEFVGDDCDWRSNIENYFQNPIDTVGPVNVLMYPPIIVMIWSLSISHEMIDVVGLLFTDDKQNAPRMCVLRYQISSN